MSGIPARAPRVWPRWCGWIAGALLLAFLWREHAPRAAPELPRPLRVQVTFPPGLAGRGEPLVVGGRQGRGDILAVRYSDEATAVLVYDSWAIGGPVSAPFALEPGQPHWLEIDMPTLTPVEKAGRGEKRPLRVVLDGRELLRADVSFYPRRPEEIYFGQNPVGGTIAGFRFRGTLVTPEGARLHGGPPLLPWHRSLWLLALQRPGWAIGALLVALATAIATGRLLGWLAARAPRTFCPPPPGRPGWFRCGALISIALFALLVTGGTFRFVYEESFGSFYDYQAQSLLQGRLDVPETAVGGEAFRVDGKFYGYFGVTPALLRMPLVLAGVGFGQVSRLFFLGYFAAALVAAHFLLRHATRVLCGAQARPSRAATLTLLASVGLGSTLFFLGSRAYVYHEAILCGAAFALWSSYFSLCHLERPTKGTATGALLCGLLAVHARPTSGLYALGVLGLVALTQAVRARRRGPPRQLGAALGLGGLVLLALLSFNALSYLKFRTFDGSPLRYSVQYTPERVARFEGKNFHLANLRHNLDGYLFFPDLRLERKFPFIFIGAHDAPSYEEAKMDLEEPTLGLPFAMPGLFALAFVGAAWAFWRAPAARTPLAVLLGGVAPMAAALFTAIVISHRYTGDFCPALIAFAAWGLAALDGESRWLRRAGLAIAGLLTIASVAVTLALALYFQGEKVWGVPDDVRQNYQRLQRLVDGLVERT